MAKLTKETSDWLDQNDPEEYGEVVIVPKDALDEERISLLASSTLGMPRRRELINSLISHLYPEDPELNVGKIEEAVQIIGEWQNQKT